MLSTGIFSCMQEISTRCNRFLIDCSGLLKYLATNVASVSLTVFGNAYSMEPCQEQLSSIESKVCPFCSDSQLIYRGKSASVMLTHKPVVCGHMLIVPNRHVARYQDLNVAEITEMGELVQKVHQVVRDKTGTDDFLQLQKNGILAGQTVPHVHIHYLPRKENHLSFMFRLYCRHWWFAMSQSEMQKEKNFYTPLFQK